MLNLKRVSSPTENDKVEDEKVENVDYKPMILNEQDLINIPLKYFGASNLKDKLPDYALKRKLKKNQKELLYWNQKIDQLLDVYDSDDDKYHFKLVRAVCQIVEDYMIYAPKLGKDKKVVVMATCSKFFDGNTELLSKVIENELDHIIKSSMFRRFMSRFEMFFFLKH